MRCRTFDGLYCRRGGYYELASRKTGAGSDWIVGSTAAVGTEVGQLQLQVRVRIFGGA